AEVIRTIDVAEPESGPEVGFLSCDFNIGELDVLRVAKEEPGSRQWPEHGWLGIGIFFFRWLQAGHLPCATAALVKIDVADLQVFDEVAGTPLMMEQSSGSAPQLVTLLM